MIEIEKYAQAAASTARTPPNSPARRAALEVENAARVAAEQFVKGLEAERDELRARLAEIEAQEPVAFTLQFAGSQRINTETTYRTQRLADEYADGCAKCGSDARPIVTPLYARPVPAQKPLTDEQIKHARNRALCDAPDGVLMGRVAGLWHPGLRELSRAIEAASLAANNLEVRRG